MEKRKNDPDDDLVISVEYSAYSFEEVNNIDKKIKKIIGSNSISSNLWISKNERNIQFQIKRKDLSRIKKEVKNAVKKTKIILER